MIHSTRQDLIHVLVNAVRPAVSLGGVNLRELESDLIPYHSVGVLGVCMVEAVVTAALQQPLLLDCSTVTQICCCSVSPDMLEHAAWPVVRFV